MSRATMTIGRGGQAAETAKMAYVPPDHLPVLPIELVDVLDPKPGETFVDCTFGAGGHSRLIAERLGTGGELIAIDRDPTAETRWREFSATAPSRTRFLRADFVAGLEGLRGEGVRPDGIVFDFGMSSMQLDAWERGFSYAYEAPLDMRMDPDQALSAVEVVNEWPQERLARVLRDFGEERRAGSIAREIVRRRPIETTSELVAAIKAAIPPADRFGRGHPAKRAFQAIRIAVNGELEAIDRALPLAWSQLVVGGRLGCGLVPLARGPQGQALPGRSRPRLRMPARDPGLRLRARARGRAGDQARARPDTRGDRAEPALGLGPPARRPQAPRRGPRRLMGSPALAPRRAPAPKRAPARRKPARKPARKACSEADRRPRPASHRSAAASSRLRPARPGGRRADPAGRRRRGRCGPRHLGLQPHRSPDPR